MDIEFLFDKAKTLTLRGKWKEAKDVYYEIIESGKIPKGVYSGLGEIALREGKFLEAESYLRKEKNKGKITSHLQQLLAISLILQGKMKEATRELEYSLSISPEDLRPYIYLGYIYLEKGEIGRAQGWLEIAKEGGVENTALDLYLTEIYYTKKNSEKLKNTLRKVREKMNFLGEIISPHFKNLLESEIRFYEGNIKEAISYIEKSKKYFNKNERIFEAGIIYSPALVKSILNFPLKIQKHT